MPDATVQGGKYPPVLGDIGDIEEILKSHAVRTVYFVTPLDTAEIIEELYFKLLDKHITVHWIPDIFSLRLVNHSVREIAGIPVLTLSETPLTGTRLLIKSLEDFILSAIILVMIAPVLIAVAIAVKLDSPGPVFFRQKRMGWNGKIFRIWKFRSMHVHQPESGVVQQAQKNDPRITRVGAFIRRTSLDELPQVFNVLAGEMSLVGPRPHAIQHDEEYSRRIADYFARHNIKPGITGLAQVRGYRGETKDIEQMIQRVESDIEYINNWSLGLDISILLRTTTAFTGKKRILNNALEIFSLPQGISSRFSQPHFGNPTSSELVRTDYRPDIGKPSLAKIL
jgi:putative colanic acid biosynthesis UDP-glucose lipid carrier transferase